MSEESTQDIENILWGIISFGQAPEKLKRDIEFQEALMKEFPSQNNIDDMYMERRAILDEFVTKIVGNISMETYIKLYAQKILEYAQVHDMSDLTNKINQAVKEMSEKSEQDVKDLDELIIKYTNIRSEQLATPSTPSYSDLFGSSPDLSDRRASLAQEKYGEIVKKLISELNDSISLAQEDPEIILNKISEYIYTDVSKDSTVRFLTRSMLSKVHRLLTKITDQEKYSQLKKRLAEYQTEIYLVHQ
jgi:hypothetical protein